MANNLCEVSGSKGTGHELQPFVVMPEEVAIAAKVVNPEVPALCAHCRREIAEWYPIKAPEVEYHNDRILFTLRKAEALARQYHSAYLSFYARKRLLRIEDKFVKTA